MALDVDMFLGIENFRGNLWKYFLDNFVEKKELTSLERTNLKLQFDSAFLDIISEFAFEDRKLQKQIEWLMWADDLEQVLNGDSGLDGVFYDIIWDALESID